MSRKKVLHTSTYFVIIIPCPFHAKVQTRSTSIHCSPSEKNVKKFQFLELSAPITKSLRQLTPRFLSWDSGTPIPHLLTFSPMISLWCKSSPYFFFLIFLLFSDGFLVRFCNLHNTDILKDIYSWLNFFEIYLNPNFRQTLKCLLKVQVRLCIYFYNCFKSNSN